MRLLVLTAAAMIGLTPHNLTDTRSWNHLLPTDRFADDMRIKNIEEILSFYDPDAVFIDPRENSSVGAEELRKLYEHVFATYDSDLKFYGLRTKITGSYGSETVEQSGFYSEDLRLRADNTVQHLCGDYHVVYKRRPDLFFPQTDTGRRSSGPDWLITRQEWTSKPCPAGH